MGTKDGGGGGEPSAEESAPLLFGTTLDENTLDVIGGREARACTPRVLFVTAAVFLFMSVSVLVAVGFIYLRLAVQPPAPTSSGAWRAQ